MRIGLGVGDFNEPGSVDDVVREVAAAHADGFPAVWVPQHSAFEAFSLLTVVGRDVPDIELGVAVVRPTRDTRSAWLWGR